MHGPSADKRLNGGQLEQDLSSESLPSRRQFLRSISRFLPAAAGVVSVGAAIGAIQAGIESREHYIESLRHTGSMNFPQVEDPDPIHGKEEMNEGNSCLRRARTWGLVSFGSAAAAVALTVRDFLKKN